MYACFVLNFPFRLSLLLPGPYGVAAVIILLQVSLQAVTVYRLPIRLPAKSVTDLAGSLIGSL